MLGLALRKGHHYWFNGKLISVFGALSNVHKPMQLLYMYLYCLVRVDY